MTAVLDIRAGQKRRMFRVAPGVGRWQSEFRQLEHKLVEEGGVDQAEARIAEVLAGLASEADPRPSDDKVKYAFLLAVLLDILSAGGRAEHVDSELYVGWPDWNAEDGREAARRALQNVSRRPQVDGATLRRLSPMFAPSLSGAQVGEVMTEGRFWLAPAETEHSSGRTYKEAFALALRLWSMPYRGREGRLRRFVLLASHANLGPDPVVAGLIEVGDDAPFSTHRDALLSLRGPEVLEWLRGPRLSDRARRVARHFAEIRDSLREIPSLPHMPAPGDVLAIQDEIEARARGRSQNSADLRVKKRLAYLLRLAHGEAAFSRLAAGAEVMDRDRSLREGVRAIHDLVAPRVHLEATVCGALPPFTELLGGKLVVAFLGHPEIVRLGASSKGTIVREVFNERIELLLPHTGLLAVTTKGLYPSHSALYNRALLPGEDGKIRLEKIGETGGETSTLFSPRTGKLAHAVVSGYAEKPKVAREYGTGGAKRHRALESAIVSVGLNESLVHAGIRRPIYAARLASNIEDVIWAGEEPRWRVCSESELYDESATRLWREKWGTKALARTCPDQRVAGVLDRLETLDLAA